MVVAVVVAVAGVAVAVARGSGPWQNMDAPKHRLESAQIPNKIIWPEDEVHLAKMTSLKAHVGEGGATSSV